MLMDTQQYILDKFGLSYDQDSPMLIEIPNVGRNDLAKLLHELDFKTGVEVGVAAGEYSEILAKTNPQMKLYGIDPYVSYKGYRDYQRQSTFAKLYQAAHQRLDGFTNFEFVPEFSQGALRQFDDNSLDFVYIDANHQDPYITEDIIGWVAKVRQGGIIAGHDYTKLKDNTGDVVHNVRGAVNDFTLKHNIKPWFVIDFFHPAKVGVKDSVSSWFWVKS